MQPFIFPLLYIALCSLADRLRGQKAIYVWIFAIILTIPLHNNILAILAIVLGEAPGWGNPLGSVLNKRDQTDYEWWEKGILQSKAVYALIARAFIFSLPLLVLFLYNGSENVLKLSLAIFGAFILAPYIARNFLNAWILDEYLRGAFIAIIYLTLS